MHYRFLLLFFIFTGTYAGAQKTYNPEPFAQTISAQPLKKHLTVIAGEEMQGRNTPSQGLEKAADYIAAQFKAAGVKPANNGSYRQTFRLAKDSAEEATMTVNGSTLALYDDFAPYFTMNENTDTSFNEYVLAGYGIDDGKRNDYAGLDVKGKLVVIFDGIPKGYTSVQTGRRSPASVSNKLKAALKKGAKAVVVVVENLPARTGMRNAAYRPVAEAAKGEASFPPIFLLHQKAAAAIAGESIYQIKAALDNGTAPLGVANAHIKLQYRSNKSYASASNVIGMVEGSDKKDEYVIITAHYDHLGQDAHGNIYYGADDDGSGTVSVIAMAEAFAKAKKAGKGPRRTVIFLTLSGEEKGLWGSEYYAAHPLFALDKTSANLNIDMIGRIDHDYGNQKDAGNYLYVIGDDKLSSELRPITDAANQRFTKLKLDRRYNAPDDPNRFYYRSDHYNFARKGIPAIFYFNGVHDDYHKTSDTVDKINFELMAKRARLVFFTAWEIANRNEMLKRDLKNE